MSGSAINKISFVKDFGEAGAFALGATSALFGAAFVNQTATEYKINSIPKSILTASGAVAGGIAGYLIGGYLFGGLGGGIDKMVAATVRGVVEVFAAGIGIGIKAAAESKLT